MFINVFDTFCVCIHSFPALDHCVPVRIFTYLYILCICVFTLPWHGIYCVCFCLQIQTFSYHRGTLSRLTLELAQAGPPGIDQFRTETQYQAGNEQRLLITAVGFYLSLHQQPSALCLRIVMQIKSLAGELIRRPLISERFVSQTEESLAEGTQRGPPG